MKILHIHTNYNRGGASFIARTIHEGLLKKNIDSVYVYGYDKLFSKKYPHTLKIGSNIIAKCNILFFQLNMRTPIYFKKNALRKLIKEADIVHLHNLHSFYIDDKEILELLKEKRVIWTIHDKWILTGRCAITKGCTNYLNMCKKCNFKSNYPSSQLNKTYERFIEKMNLVSDLKNLTVVVQSEWLKNLILNSPISKAIKNNIIIIKNGIDTNFFTINDYDESFIKGKNIIKKDKNFLFVAEYLNADKGFDDLLKIAEKYSDYNFIAIGKLFDIKEPFPQNVICLGKQDKKSLKELYNFCDGYLMLSKDENYPTTILEAISCGCYVISRNTGAVAEMIKNENGYVFNDIKGIEQIMNKNIETKETKVFSSEDMIESYLRLYKEIEKK